MAARARLCEHVELDVDLAAFGGSALIGDGEIPKDRPLDAAGYPVDLRARAQHGAPVARAGWAEVLGAERIVIGVNALDYSGYPDCRPEFIAAFEYLATLATKAGVEGPAASDLGAAPAADQGRHHPPRARARRRLRADAQLLRPATGRAPVRPLRQLPAAREGIRGSRR